MNDRYIGKPFLRLLELYILRSIEELSENYSDLLLELEPKLQKTYESRKRWYEIIADEMGLPENFNSIVLDAWQKVRLYNSDPENFAQKFVDANFL